MARNMLGEVKDSMRPYFSVVEIQTATARELWRHQVDLLDSCARAGQREINKIWQEHDFIGLLGVPVALAQELSGKCADTALQQWDTLVAANRMLSGLGTTPLRRGG